ncbi:MAG: hypothetical protein IJE14_09130 [Clostridia bacterium]|nr:hypothetical protein [Clostridia bacterium]
MDEQKIFNRRILGFTADMLVFAVLTFCFFRLDTAWGVLGVAATVVQAVLILISPIYYVFTADSLTIKYFFGLEENIPWNKVISIRERHNFHYKRYVWLKSYKIDYRTVDKTPSFMDGTISKNKQITKLLKEYCPKKFEENKAMKR